MAIDMYKYDKLLRNCIKWTTRNEIGTNLSKDGYSSKLSGYHNEQIKYLIDKGYLYHDCRSEIYHRHINNVLTKCSKPSNKYRVSPKLFIELSELSTDYQISHFLFSLLNNPYFIEKLSSYQQNNVLFKEHLELIDSVTIQPFFIYFLQDYNQSMNEMKTFIKSVESNFFSKSYNNILEDFWDDFKVYDELSQEINEKVNQLIQNYDLKNYFILWSESDTELKRNSKILQKNGFTQESVINHTDLINKNLDLNLRIILFNLILIELFKYKFGYYPILKLLDSLYSDKPLYHYLYRSIRPKLY